MSTSRTASHAGSWYSNNSSQLNQQLSKWLSDAQNPGNTDRVEPTKGCKAIIAPHAGYSYSGPAAAYAYGSIDIEPIKRVFVLGPSHHVYLEGCALSRCKTYSTPIGDLPLDTETVKELHETGKFEWMDRETDEDEHSIEMHLPYIRKIFENREISIVPILVGSLSFPLEQSYGSLLSTYLSDPQTLFIISSDFCHWGTRFSYTHFQPPNSTDLSKGQALTVSNLKQVTQEFNGEVWKGIEKLDRLGMECCEFLAASEKGPGRAHEEFRDYLKRTKNTICGRHPIGVLLGALSELEKEKEGSGGGARLEWKRYEQSSRVEGLRDSSVSYASAVITFSQ